MRRYVEHRRAWSPRLWPVVLVLGGLTGGLVFVLAPGPLLAVVVSVLVGTAGSWARWAIWRWRHPVVPLDVYVTELIRERRRAARWN